MALVSLSQTIGLTVVLLGALGGAADVSMFSGVDSGPASCWSTRSGVAGDDAGAVSGLAGVISPASSRKTIFLTLSL